MQVRVYEDRAWKDIDGILQNLALEDHSDADCILIAVLSHGELGILYASDHAYKPDKLWAPFNSEACPSLAGKPKLFFIQVSNYNLKDHYGLIQSRPIKVRDLHQNESLQIPAIDKSLFSKNVLFICKNYFLFYYRKL